MGSTVYQTEGTCSRLIEVSVDEQGTVTACNIVGGCAGNTRGLSQIVVGLSARDVIGRLSGIRCGMRPTSCPDQLCRALEQALANGSPSR